MCHSELGFSEEFLSISVAVIRFEEDYITKTRTMNDSDDPLALSPFNSSFTKVKETTSFNQVLTFKASSMQRVIQVMQRVVQKSTRRACQLFCCPLDKMLCENVECYPALNHQPEEVKTTQVAIQNMPSTILIVNISNSTLIDCVIGNDNHSAVAESQPLMQKAKLQMDDQMGCSCSRRQQGATQTSDHPSIHIEGSHLNCVIIGDNNYMHADQTYSTDAEDPQV